MGTEPTAREKELEAEVGALKLEVLKLTALVQDLMARLGMNSSNSSRPPSSNPPWLKGKKGGARPKKGSTGKRKRGGQPGHKGSKRDVVPAAEVDAFKDVVPSHCAGCGEEVQDGGPRQIGRTHQVTELPPPVLHTTEYRFMACRCTSCGVVTEAPDKNGVTRSAFGPNIHALAGLLTARFRLSRRDVRAAFSSLYGLKMSIGTVQNMLDRVSVAVAGTVAQIAADIRCAPWLHADETGWRAAREKAWLWALTIQNAAYFRVDAHRSREALSRILPLDYQGVVHCDRWRPYEVFPVERRQLCHAHLRRDFQGLIDRGGAGARIGRALLKASDKLFEIWHRFKAGMLSRSKLWFVTKSIRAKWWAQAERAKKGTHKKARALGRDLIRQWDALWTFLAVEGVEPTNNDVEQALRHGVIWRKISFGSDSLKGAVFVGRMLTVVETSRRRGVNLLSWLQRALTASARNQPAPMLLPG